MIYKSQKTLDLLAQLDLEQLEIICKYNRWSNRSSYASNYLKRNLGWVNKTTIKDKKIDDKDLSTIEIEFIRFENSPHKEILRKTWRF